MSVCLCVCVSVCVFTTSWFERQHLARGGAAENTATFSFGFWVLGECPGQRSSENASQSGGAEWFDIG